MLKAILIDDEKLALESLEWEINNFYKEINVIGKFSNPYDAIEAINKLYPDLVLLDIEMPELDGFQLLEKLENTNFDLIITTAYNQYAIQAFKANAIDYLLKPIDPEELIEAINKVKERHSKKEKNHNIETILNKIMANSNEQKIPLPLNNKIIFILPDDIIYCKSEGSYTSVFLTNNQKKLISKSIKQFEKSLPKNKFIRTHRSYVVNISKIIEFVRAGFGELVLINGDIIPVSRMHKEDILNALNIG